MEFKWSDKKVMEFCKIYAGGMKYGFEYGGKSIEEKLSIYKRKTKTVEVYDWANKKIIKMETK